MERTSVKTSKTDEAKAFSVLKQNCPELRWMTDPAQAWELGDLMVDDVAQGELVEYVMRLGIAEPYQHFLDGRRTPESLAAHQRISPEMSRFSVASTEKYSPEWAEKMRKNNPF